VRIRWTEPTAQALENIQDYIARDNPLAAVEVARRIRIIVNQLAEHPRIGRRGGIRGTYELVIHGVPYIVPYRIKKAEIQILSVYHTSRKWPPSFE